MIPELFHSLCPSTGVISVDNSTFGIDEGEFFYNSGKVGGEMYETSSAKCWWTGGVAKGPEQ